MDLSTLGIPGLSVRNYGTKSSPLEIVETTVRLEAWDGYLTQRRENGKLIADGTVLVQFACNERSTREDWEPQIAAFNYLLQHQHEIRDRIVESVIANIRDLIGYLDPSDPGVPPIIAGNASSEIQPSPFRLPPSPDLRPYIGPRSVGFIEVTKDGTDYAEWFLNCTWDDEHGLAAVTHRNRLIDLDRGETDIYKIFADNGTLEEELKQAEYYRTQPSKPKPPKPWWKFW